MSQGIWVGIYKNWTWIGIPVMVVALAALGLLIAGLVSVVKKAQLFRVPLAETQEVHFEESGRVVLNIEGPRGSRRFAHVGFELTGMNGERIEGARVSVPTVTSGISTARMEMVSYDISKPGHYLLRMTGLGPAEERDARHAVVFTRPYHKQMVACILGLLFAFFVFATSLGLFLFRVLGNRSAT